MIKSKIDNDEIDPKLSLHSILPVCAHVGKALKASFLNWWLKWGDERSNLSQLRTLRNRSENTTKETFQKLLPKNDHVKNKDRPDPSAVFWTNQVKRDWRTEPNWVRLSNHRTRTGQVYTRNRMGMIPSAISIAVANYGWILFSGIWCKVKYINIVQGSTARSCW